MHRFLLHNDDIRDAGEFGLSPGQVGLLAGWGVFSTLRVYDGVMFAFDRHWERMRRSAAARQWDRIHNDIAEGKPARLIVGGPSRTVQQDARNQSLMHKAFAYGREAGGWTVYVDEFELISSQRQFNLGKWVERMLISARSEGTSVVTSFQAAAWVSKHATRQARMTVMWPTGDRDMIKAVASSMGRDWRQVAAAVDELPQYHVVVIPRGKLGGPLICTSAPKL